MRRAHVKPDQLYFKTALAAYQNNIKVLVFHGTTGDMGIRDRIFSASHY